MTHIAKLVAAQLLVAAVVSAIVLHVYIRLDEQRTLILNRIDRHAHSDQDDPIQPITHYNITLDANGSVATTTASAAYVRGRYGEGTLSLVYKRPLF
jgi:hypothetical protein